MRRRGVRTSRTWCTTLWAPSTLSGPPHDPLPKLPHQETPQHPATASPCITHTTPTSTTITSRPRLQESRGERILRSGHAHQQDSTRMCRGSRWLTASTRTLSPRPAPASRPPRTPPPHARCSGIPSCRAHTPTVFFLERWTALSGTGFAMTTAWSVRLGPTRPDLPSVTSRHVN
ncbi:uncharacterized protein LOC123502255 isoform X2 [Portunus trituberculatus]|uniref:uncharacterized protein LOC123502255 isoform X2 n=1 Tax=Portunus trituberculatus TaxID=210409 RepID=UPI001E1CCE9D|nr:uncharacterized protein LOC123502255 isoform X2 [Portunus trituberculatus]